MITIICGDPGVGKTALMTHFATQYLQYDADYELAIDKINNYNNMGYNLSTPSHLVFSDYKISYNLYGKNVESYFCNGYYLGMPNAQHQTMFLPPYSKIFLSEAQRYYDSRKYNSFSDFISQFYEQHRHYGLQIYLDCQRVGLIDLNIRGISTRVILVESMSNDIDSHGRIISNHWQCREFSSAIECERYLDTLDKNIGQSITISHDNTIEQFPTPVFRDTPQFATSSNFRLIKSKSRINLPVNIFDNYESCNKELAFLRGRKGHDFSLYKHLTDDMYINDLDDIYSFDAPRTFYKLPDKALAEIPKGRVLTI